MSLPKINWKVAGIFYLAISFIFFFAFFYMAFDNAYPVDHQAAIAGNSNWPESYLVHISPARAFALTWGFSRVVGLILWIVVGLYIVAAANDLTGKALTKNFVLIYALLTLASAAFFFASGSNVFARNSVRVTPERYQVIMDNKDSLGNLFQKGHLIK